MSYLKDIIDKQRLKRCLELLKSHVATSVNGNKPDSNGAVNVDVGVKTIDSITPDEEGNVKIPVATDEEVEAGEVDNKYMTPANTLFAINKRTANFYNSVADMKSDKKLKAGMTACTLGYYEPNDGGAGTYIIRAKQDGDADDEGSLHEISSKLVAELVVENETVNVKQFGAKGDGVSDDTQAIQRALDNARNCKIDSVTYIITASLILHSNLHLFGDGTIKCTVQNINVIDATSETNINIEGLTFLSSTDVVLTSSTSSFLHFLHCDNISVLKCTFKDIPHSFSCCFETSSNCRALYNHIENYRYTGLIALNGCSFIKMNNNIILNGYGQNKQGLRYPLCLSGYNNLSSNVTNSCYLEACYNYIEDAEPYWEGIDAHGGNFINISYNTIIGTAVGIAITHRTSGKPIFQASNVYIRYNNINIKANTTLGISFIGITLSGSATDTINNNFYVAYNTVNTKISEISEDTYLYGKVSMLRIKDIQTISVSHNNLTGAILTGIYLENTTDSVIKNNKINNVYPYKEEMSAYFYCISSKGTFINNICGKNSEVTSTFGIITKGSNPCAIIAHENIFDNIGDTVTSNTYFTLFKSYTAPPQSYIANVGDIIYNIAPENNKDVGWVCTKEGDSTTNTYAVWKSIGKVLE